MAAHDRRMALGDRVLCSLRKWLSQYGLKRGCTRADVLNQYLSAGSAVERGGNDPLRILQLAIDLQGRGVDPEQLLSLQAGTPAGRGGRRR